MKPGGSPELQLNWDRVILALDVDDKGALARALELLPQVRHVKIGMRLFYRYGFDLLRALPQELKIFLDLKLHDIPSVVASALRVMAKHRVWMTTVHTQGGLEMMRQAKEAAGKELLVVGVTVLTSLSTASWRALYPESPPLPQVAARLARRAWQAGLDGVVCSPREVGHIKQAAPKLLAVCPGIRLPGDPKGDQKRVATPQEAIRRGADYLVIGRSLLPAR